MSLRLFVALRPPVAIRERLLALMGGIAAARWQDDEQLHLTLRFVGEVDERTAEDLAAALAQVHAPAPCVALAGVGRFGDARRTAALWAGVAPHDGLAGLHRKVDRACVRAGLPPERRAYLPHVTLARLPRSAGADPAIDRWLADAGGLASAPFDMTWLILYESRLGRDGARYEPLARWPLEPI
ncbi:RNA 2',3'-cyclic phosphodiesterase [uncultured Sphingomonas sp.]|uniref:RNA 2',3'-cyclic phosphodiesterase n=1 Tax=uncultured Sphingomonas sp. TaxID=158754 RepID=UPI0035C9B92E